MGLLIHQVWQLSNLAVKSYAGDIWSVPHVINARNLKDGSHGATCLIRILLCYCNQFKVIIHESWKLHATSRTMAAVKTMSTGLEQPDIKRIVTGSEPIRSLFQKNWRSATCAYLPDYLHVNSPFRMYLLVSPMSGDDFLRFSSFLSFENYILYFTENLLFVTGICFLKN